MTDNAEKLKLEVENCRAEIKNLDKMCNAQVAMNGELLADKQILEKEKEEQLETIERQGKRITKLSADYADMWQENEKLKEQMDQMQQDYENRLQDAKTEVEELLKQCDEFQLQIGVFTVEIQAKDEKINEWETAYEKLEGVNKANEFKIQDL